MNASVKKQIQKHYNAVLKNRQELAKTVLQLNILFSKNNYRMNEFLIYSKLKNVYAGR